MAMKDLVNISESMMRIDPEGCTIRFSKQTQYFAQDLEQKFVSDDQIQAAFQQFNNLALSKEELAINIATVLTSKPIEDIKFKNSETTVRNEVLRLLQTNFGNHQLFKADGIEKAYNSITFLGEFYNRLKIANQHIRILGQSLLQLLEQELTGVLEKRVALTPLLAKLVLTQITLNGSLLKKLETEKLNAFLDVIRKVIVEANEREVKGKAFLMLALDLYYSNFTASAMISLQRVYKTYLSQPESQPATPAATQCVNPFEEEDEVPAVPEKRQRVEIAVQTEVAICDVFRAGPVIVTPVERVLLAEKKTSTSSGEATTTTTAASTCTNVSPNREDVSTMSSPSVPLSPSNSSSAGTRKSKIDPRIRNVRIGRIYPTPVIKSPGSSGVASSVGSNGDVVGKLSVANVTRHEIAMMKENTSRMNRIRDDYLDRIVPPSLASCPSIRSASETYMGKENMEAAIAGGGGDRSEVVSGRGERGLSLGGESGIGMLPASNGSAKKTNNKFLMEENEDNSTIDPSYFDDYVPVNDHAMSKSFLQFLGNK